nr:MAG TPA: hypothetical protein [Caudoviricetes sp.]DAQ49911.1 MAG TPA: hypothetical protein [Caudoviricetes sp.]
MLVDFVFSVKTACADFIQNWLSASLKVQAGRSRQRPKKPIP